MRHIMHFVMFKHASLLRVVHESEKDRVDQASVKVHPPMVLVSSLTSMNLLRILTFSATKASPGACKPFPCILQMILHFEIIIYALLCSGLGITTNCCIPSLIH
jgi:hypothetical protein